MRLEPGAVAPTADDIRFHTSTHYDTSARTHECTRNTRNAHTKIVEQARTAMAELYAMWLLATRAPLRGTFGRGLVCEQRWTASFNRRN